MSNYEWIVCERRGQWAAALRMAIARHAQVEGRIPRLYEVRSLEELIERLAAKPDSLALVEVHSGNLAQVLSWSTLLPVLHRNARFAALVDRSLATQDEAIETRLANERRRLIEVLLEAGAAEIGFSPRQLPRLLPTALKHAEIWGIRRQTSDMSQTITDWAWSLLPWQQDQRPIG